MNFVQELGAGNKKFLLLLSASDHRLVVARFDLPEAHRVMSRRAGRPENHRLVDAAGLACDPIKREEYQNRITDELSTSSTLMSGASPGEQWSSAAQIMEKAAKAIVGTRKVFRNPHGLDSVLAELSEKMRVLRLQIVNSQNNNTRLLLRTERNRISHQLRRRARECAASRIDKKVQEIENLKDGARMFQAVRMLRSNQHQSPVILDCHGKIIAQPDEMAKKIADHFHSAFTDDSQQPVTSEDIPKGPLDNPIVPGEVAKAARRLKNNKAAGPDHLPAELFKYAPADLHSHLATLYNRSIEEGQHMTMGEGVLIPIQKSGKPKGPASSLRPIVLLNVVRKLLSLIVLSRINGKVQKYVSSAQSGFRPGRSTADVVWSPRWLAARCQHVQWNVGILGIDMSKAFDTISRRKLLTILESFLGSDEVRIIQLLITNTTLKARVKHAESSAFPTTTGTPQGDSLSPVLFIIYLEAALREVIANLPPRPVHDTDLGLPLLLGYADDVDFISTSPEYLDTILALVDDRLGKWDLRVNQSKTERTSICRSKDRVAEEWRRTRKLGSLIGDREDVARRIQLASVSFKKVWSMWMRGHIISESLRVRVYNAFILPILLYNSGTWGLTPVQMRNIDTFHRRQLRIVIGVRYPQIITNADLYRRTGSQPVSALIRLARLKLLGHICRLPGEAPAQEAMSAYYVREGGEKRFRGRPPSTLPIVLAIELSRANISLKSTQDLQTLRKSARDRKEWHAIIQKIVSSS